MSKKRLDITAIASELSQASVFFRREVKQDQEASSTPTPLPEASQLKQEGEKQRVGERTIRPTDQPTNSRSDQQSERPTDQPTRRPTDEETNRPTDQHVDRFAASRQRRELQRVAFDLEKEQIRAIRRVKAERELKEGRDVSLSELGREAFEKYLNSLKAEE
jgi:hypothetical protein